MLMTTPQTLELPLDIYGTESLVLAVKFDVGDEIWALSGGEGEKTNMFVLQPSERMHTLYSWSILLANWFHFNPLSDILYSTRRVHTHHAFRRQYSIARKLGSRHAMVPNLHIPTFQM